MIRINLLPVKKAKRREAGQRQLLYMGMAILLAVGGVVFVHVNATGHRENVRKQNRAIQSDIDRLKAELGDYDKIRAQREDLIKKKKSIAALQAGRTGPVYLFRELSEILTPGKGPTFDRVKYEEMLRADPNVGFNPSWDTRKVWLETFDEDQKKVRIKGAARSHEDVAEFIKRLSLSVFFSDVNLDGTSQAAGAAGSTIKHVTFTLTAAVSY